MTTGKFSVPIGDANVTVPGVYTTTDKSAMVAPRGTPSRSLAIVGSCRGGRVGGITRVLRGDESRILRGGLAAQMARAAFAHGLSEVQVVRVDKASSATMDLGIGQLIGINPGTASSAYQAKVVTNPDRSDAVDLYLKDASGAESDEEYRLIGPLLDVLYVGPGTNPSLALTYDRNEEAVVLTFAAEGDPAASMSLNSNATPTVSEVAQAINRSASWTAQVASYPALPLLIASLKEVTFDKNKATVVGGSGLLQIILSEGDSRIADFVAYTSPDDITPGTGPGGLRVTGSYEFFVGGSDGPMPTANDYIEALRLLENTNVTAIAMGSGNAAVAAALNSHCEAMSSVKTRKERYGGVGIAPQNTKTAFIKAATELTSMFGDSDLMYVAENIPYDTNIITNRMEEQHGAVLTAAMLAIKVATRPEEPLTFKRVKFPRLKYQFSTEELEELIEAGGSPVHFDQEMQANICMAGVTTYTRDANVASRKLAAVDAIQYLQQKVRRRVAGLSVGQVADQARINYIISAVKALLKEEVRSGSNPTGILTPGLDIKTGEAREAFYDVEGVFDGYDLVGVDFKCNLVGEIAYVRTRISVQPVRIEATREGGNQ